MTRKTPSRKRAKAKPAPARRKGAGKKKSRKTMSPKPAAKGGSALARMAAQMAAETSDDAPVVASKWKPGTAAPADAERIFEDLDVPAPAPAQKPKPDLSHVPPPLLEKAPTGPAPSDGVAVHAKGPSKFSLADLEELKKILVIKGATTVIDGFNLDAVKWNEEGLVPVIAQDRVTGAVLMQAWMNREALAQTLKDRRMTYWSRQRNKLWLKGEESGHFQSLVEIKPDCDSDSLLAVVEQEGPACHRDTTTCWSEGRDPMLAGFLGELDRVIQKRGKDSPSGSHTAKLLKDPKAAAAKVEEEAEELLAVLKGKPNPDSLEHEAADLLYHVLVACRAKGVGLHAILKELRSRHGDGA